VLRPLPERRAESLRGEDLDLDYSQFGGEPSGIGFFGRGCSTRLITRPPARAPTSSVRLALFFDEASTEAAARIYAEVNP
jgi:hypothetical protein